MTAGAIMGSQRNAAKVVGIAYLLAMAVATFSEFFVRGRLIVASDAVETARNIMAHEQFFRLGVASYVACMLVDSALIAALYVILEPVNHGLAVVALFLRLVETVIGVVATLHSFDTLRFLSGAKYLQAFSADQLAALARVPIGAYGSALEVQFVFFGAGSAVFGYLWLKSNYIPNPLAALGIVGSLLIAAGSFAYIVFPSALSILEPADMAPIFIFEMTMGVWLLVKPLRPTAVARTS